MTEYKKYLSNRVVDIIHQHFPEEGYPVQQHEDGFKAAVKILKNNKISPESLDKAKHEITRSVLSAYTPDSTTRPKWGVAEKKAQTIITQLSVLKLKDLELVKA